ncbi:MAG: Sec-independent protein translocase protein TatB [Gemmobacter sp.]|uniref:Sec-independent protein translocase protein TatB n=1 Tax=Gemmobacter sp. TaxID=1898957 RepID=UPI00391C7C96
MFDLGMSELLVIGIVALIVIGPKDLPVMFRTMGRFTAKARNMAREFSRAMEAAADESGVKDVAKDLRKVTDPKSMGLDALKDAASRFEAWDPKRSARPEPAASAPAPAVPSVPAAPAHGPATQALAESRAAQSAAAAEAAAAMRAARDGEPGQGT